MIYICMKERYLYMIIKLSVHLSGDFPGVRENGGKCVCAIARAREDGSRG